MKNTERTKHQRGPTPWPRGWGARPTPWARLPASWAPGSPPVTIFCYMKSFTLEKIISKLLGRNTTVTRRNLGGTYLGLRRSCSAGETSLREGEIISIIITIDPLSGWGVNIHQHLHQHHLLSNPSSSLVSNLCTKTSDWYLWVASSVDCSW